MSLSASSPSLLLRRSSSLSSHATGQTVDVGAPQHPTGWSAATVAYHNFAHLPRRKGESYVDSRPFRAHGLDWYLRLHPGGATSANGDDMVSLYLRCKSAAERNVTVAAEFSLALLRNDGQADGLMRCPRNAFRRKRKGWPNFAERSRVLDPAAQLLDGYGTLRVIVQIQLFREKDANFVPRNEVDLLRLFEEANAKESDDGHVGEGGGLKEKSSTAHTSDVMFTVEGEMIRAHRLILKLAAPALAQLCEDVDEDEALPILGVRAPVFRGVLRHAYGGAVPDEAWVVPEDGSAHPGDAAARNDGRDVLSSPSMELLDAANRFGAVGLKILAETKVAEADIGVATASDLILYADAKDCALLKERVIDYFVAHPQEIQNHPSFRKVEESASILSELMKALVSEPTLRSSSLGNDDIDYDSMGVNLLRRRLDERGLDVDGSRETLLRRLAASDGGRPAPRDQRRAATGDEGGGG